MKTPFTQDQFFGVFEHYNQTIFPGQLIILLLGLAALVFLHSRIPLKNKILGVILSLLWIWTGLVYHIAFFSGINSIAKVFGGIFILQGLVILSEMYRTRLEFVFNPDIKSYLGYFFILFGLLIYPAISFFMEGSFIRTISLGLPCPTTIFTLGFFMFTGASFKRYLLIIPTLWAIVGISAAMHFGVYQDLMILVAALAALFFSSKLSKNNKL